MYIYEYTAMTIYKAIHIHVYDDVGTFSELTHVCMHLYVVVIKL